MATPDGPGIPLDWSEIPMSKITVLAEGQITLSDAIVVVLVEPADMPSTVVIHWPAAPTVCDPKRFSSTGDAAVRVFASAVVRLAQVRRDRRL